MIKFVSDLQQAGGFLLVFRFRHNITEILFKVALNIINPNQVPSGETRYYEIGICFFSTNYSALRSKRKRLVGWDNVSEWNDMSIHGLLFQYASTMEIQKSMLV